MVHQYKNNGYNIVLDVNSGSVHVVDDLVYDMIALYETSSREEMIENFQRTIKRKILKKLTQKLRNLSKRNVFLPRIFIKIISLILRNVRRLSKPYACTLPMTVTWHANTALPKRANIMDGER